MKHVVIGDIHSRNDEPFQSALMAFLEWLQSILEPEDVLIQLGDVLHEAKSNGEANQLMVRFFQSVKTQRIKILQGNHDYNRREGSGLLPLLEIGRDIEIIDYPKSETIDGINYLFLPHYYPFSNDLPPMEDFYSNKEGQFAEKFGLSYDYILTHVADEQQTAFKRFCDLSFLEGKRVSGHVHHFSDTYLGSSVLTRASERGKNSYIALIDPSTKSINYKMTPKFMDYYTVKFGEAVPTDLDMKIPFLDIEDAPLREEAEKMYKAYHIHSISVKQKYADSVSDNTEVKSQSISDYFTKFVESNKIDGKLYDILNGVVNAS